MITLDITETNKAVRDLLDRTKNPRHRFLLMAYDRHREMAGRYERDSCARHDGRGTRLSHSCPRTAGQAARAGKN